MTPGRDVPARPAGSVLAVCAHPDDESFGLGAVLAFLVGAGATVSVLCLTHGEASTLGCAGDLRTIRAGELAQAAEHLGVAEAVLLDYPDGALAGVGLEELASEVQSVGARVGADTLLAFDLGGVTGHPDHHRATEAALLAAGRLDLRVIGWAVPDDVAAELNREFATRFVGRPAEEAELVLHVDRARQMTAIGSHASQANDNPVLWRRLELQGDREYLVGLRPGPNDSSSQRAWQPADPRPGTDAPVT